MKKFVFYVLALTLSVVLFGCGELTPSFQNEKAKIKLGHLQLGLESHDLNVQQQQLDLEVEQQLFNIQGGGYAKDNGATGWKVGLIKNRWLNRVIHVEFLSAGTGKLIASHDIGDAEKRNGGPWSLRISLPMGKYQVVFYEYTVNNRLEIKGKNQTLEVTNLANRYDNGVPYYFVVSN